VTRRRFETFLAAKELFKHLRLIQLCQTTHLFVKSRPHQNPGAMQAMMTMKKIDLAELERPAKK
jgi:hypothetical protein